MGVGSTPSPTSANPFMDDAGFGGFGNFGGGGGGLGGGGGEQKVETGVDETLLIASRQTALHMAVANRHADVVSVFMEHRGKINDT